MQVSENENGQTVVTLATDEAVFGVDNQGKLAMFLPKEKENEHEQKVPDNIYQTMLASSILLEDNSDLLEILNLRFLEKLEQFVDKKEQDK